MRAYHVSCFYFGVLHPVALTLSRLLEEPSLVTTVEGVYLYLCFAATFMLTKVQRIRYERKITF
jgi:hypothetical protein